MRPSRLSAVAFAVITVALLLGVVASAHHSRAGYDSAPGKLVTNNGVVSSVIWRNPHVFVIWDVNSNRAQITGPAAWFAYRVAGGH